MSILNLQQKTPEVEVADAAQLAAVSRQANTILAISVISMLFCCLGGIIATYKAYMAKQDADAGDISAAKRGIEIATIWMIVTYLIGILSVLGRLAGRH